MGMGGILNINKRIQQEKEKKARESIKKAWEEINTTLEFHGLTMITVGVPGIGGISCQINLVIAPKEEDLKEDLEGKTDKNDNAPLISK